MNERSTPMIPWLFSPLVDLAAFLGSAVVALGLLAWGQSQAWLEQQTPDWLWIAAVLMVDVAHVYATGFRVYFDRAELRRRPWLYGLVPLLSFLIGMAVYSEGSHLFWRALAYLAVFHFIRQQYGWVALYRAKGGENGRLGRLIDSAAIYLATIYPLVYWHTHPRHFHWFVATDFATLPVLVEKLLAPCYWTALVAYVLRAAYRAVMEGALNPGKDLVVATTAVCWYVGIITYDSDYAFTVTNVITHGVPYLVLIDWYRVRQGTLNSKPVQRIRPWWRIVQFLSVIWLLAYMEELCWDCGVWHDREWLFGREWEVEGIETWLVPLLAVPQLTHYILDGFIWRRNAFKQP